MPDQTTPNDTYHDTPDPQRPDPCGACDAIFDYLDGTEWEAETLEVVAAMIERATGRTIRDPEDV